MTPVTPHDARHTFDGCDIMSFPKKFLLLITQSIFAVTWCKRRINVSHTLINAMPQTFIAKDPNAGRKWDICVKGVTPVTLWRGQIKRKSVTPVTPRDARHTFDGCDIMPELEWREP